MQESNLENLKNYTPSNKSDVLKLLRGLAQLKKDIESATENEKKTGLVLVHYEKEFDMEGKKDSLLTQKQLSCRVSTEKHGYCIQFLEELSSEVDLIEDSLNTLLGKYSMTMRLAKHHAEEARLVASEL